MTEKTLLIHVWGVDMSEKAKDIYMEMVRAIKGVDTLSFHKSCVRWCIQECTAAERKLIAKGKKELSIGSPK